MCNVLDIDENTSTKMIKKIYKRQSLALHPDKISFADIKTREKRENKYIQMKQAYEYIKEYHEKNGTWGKDYNE